MGSMTSTGQEISSLGNSLAASTEHHQIDIWSSACQSMDMDQLIKRDLPCGKNLVVVESRTSTLVSVVYSAASIAADGVVTQNIVVRRKTEFLFDWALFKHRRHSIFAIVRHS